MGVGHADDGVDAQGVTPQRILSDVGFAGRYDDLAVEGDLLALLRKTVVTIGIHQGIHAVVTGLDAFDDEASAAVSSTHALERFFSEHRVFQVVV